MAQILTANLITEPAEPGKESCEVTWAIPNWRGIRKSEGLVSCQEAIFDTGSSPTGWFKTNWLVELKVCSNGYSGKKVHMYWKMLGITGLQTMKVEAKLQTKLWNFSTNSPTHGRDQCPVFAAMLNSDLSENATGGIIRMTDITGKTIRILLHNFYTGDLLGSWRDPDTIVEFTYAVGKYQMTDVLEMLDDMLGRNSGGDASNLDVQLINLAGKLEVKKPEKRLLQRIVAQVNKLTTSGHLFKLFGFEEEEISEMAENLAIEQLGEWKILKLVDYLYGSYDSQNLYENEMPLLALVRKEGLKKVEKNLLKSDCRKGEKCGGSAFWFIWSWKANGEIGN